MSVSIMQNMDSIVSKKPFMTWIRGTLRIVRTGFRWSPQEMTLDIIDANIL